MKFRENFFIEDINAVLAAFTYCMRPDEIIEDILVALKEKHIGVKTNTIEWLTRALRQNSEGVEVLADKLLPTLVPMLDEADKGVREAVSKLIGLFVHLCGEGRVQQVPRQSSSTKDEVGAEVRPRLRQRTGSDRRREV